MLLMVSKSVVLSKILYPTNSVLHANKPFTTTWSAYDGEMKLRELTRTPTQFVYCVEIPLIATSLFNSNTKQTMDK